MPNSLNYTDIKPESIENEIKLVRFTPTSNITGARGGDVVKFMLSGNGFLDPYSTYLRFDVSCPDLQAGEVRFLDRSAHSFISRIVIRSQGVEIERIENYDVIAAMINDMIYSPEQNMIHHWEGYPTQLVARREARDGVGN